MNIVASYDPYDLGMENEKLFAAIATTKENGFTLFDILVPQCKIDEYINLVEIFKQKKLTYSIHADYKLDLSIVQGEKKEQTIFYFKKLIRFAIQINAKLITLHLSGTLDVAENRVQQLSSVLDCMGEIYAYAESLNVSLAIENLEGNRLGSDTNELDAMFNAFPNLKFTLDIAHAILQKQDPQELYNRYRERVVLIHVSGISSKKPHYEITLRESEYSLRDILTWCLTLDLPIKIENIFFEQFMQSYNFFLSLLEEKGTQTKEELENISKKLSKRVQTLKPSLIKEFSKKRDGVISLAQGVPQISIPVEVNEAMAYASCQEQAFKYTEQSGLRELKEILAERLQQRFKKEIAAENIVVTAGAIAGLACTFSALLDEGDEVILFTPTYPSYVEQLQLLGVKPIFVECLPENWSIDINKLKSAITPKTKCIVLCSPSNPTGSIISIKETKEIADLAREKNLFIINDLTYEDLMYESENTNAELFADLIGELYMGVFSFSKNVPLSGLRIGYVYAAREIIKGITKTNDALSICAPALSQYVALELFKDKRLERCIKNTQQALSKRRTILCDRLDKLKEFFFYTKPLGAQYVFVKLLKTDDDFLFCQELLKEAKVAVVPGSSFGTNGKGYIRISFGASEAEITEAMNRVEIFLNKNKLI